MDEPGSLGGGDPLGGNEHAATTNNFNDSMDDDSNSNHNNEPINNPQVSNNLSNNLASSQSSHFEHHNGASGNGSGQDDNDPFAGKEFYRTYNIFLFNFSLGILALSSIYKDIEN